MGVLYKKNRSGGYIPIDVDDAEVIYFRNFRTRICSATPKMHEGSLISVTGILSSSTDKKPYPEPPSR